MATRRFAVLTSGGDAPGMNATIRAVVRTGLHLGCEVVGVQDGFKGLPASDFRTLTARDVGGIIQQGGTILGSARCLEFQTEAGVRRGLDALRANGIHGLAVIGGNGSQAGAAALANTGFPVVGIASTIDNDLCGTDVSIGVDTPATCLPGIPSGCVRNYRDGRLGTDHGNQRGTASRRKRAS